MATKVAKTGVRREKGFLYYLDKRDAHLETIGFECHRIQQISADVLIENTKKLGEVTQVLSEAVRTLERINNGR